MNPTAITTTRQTGHQRRLKEIVKRLVIELGYLEHCLTEGR